MHNRNIKKYREFLINTKLFENVATDDVVDRVVTSVVEKNNYNKRYYNQLLMLNVVNDVLFESVEDVALKIHTNDWEKSPELFYDSFRKSDKIDFLTPYTLRELKDFNLFKVSGYDIGFAIKKDGDIILVHNNSNIKGIGIKLMEKAIENGGKKLDHFDGFLTGFYKKIGFNFDENYIFNPEYAPDNWTYLPVNINNPKTSIYAEELTVDEVMFNKAKTRYNQGEPDVVMRILG